MKTFRRKQFSAGLTALVFVLSFMAFACNSASQKSKQKISIGFLDAFSDETIQQAKDGFMKAMNDSGWSEEKGNIEILYRNAQNDIPALSQACDFFVARAVNLIAANTTLSTITAIQKTSVIPVCMMVAPDPELAGLKKNGKNPENLFGVFETLSYIDTSVTLVRQLFPLKQKLGVIFNQAEPQSVNALKQILSACKRMNLQCVTRSVSNSSETKMAAEALIDEGIDCFFAMPDNTVFASFEVIAQVCREARIPVFTSEAGLVKRGALCAYGADMFFWGYQAGIQAARYLKNPAKGIPPPEPVLRRNKVINTQVAAGYLDTSNIQGFVQLK